MRVIAITSPSLVDEDVYLIRTLFEYGVDVVHLRKPDAGVDGCRKLLGKLTKDERAKMIVHDFPELYDEFSLKGIHVNRHVAQLPTGYEGCKTRSCHSFEEIQRYKDEYDYLFLSPVFDSISKVGYRSKFTERELLKASADGVIDEKMCAFSFNSNSFFKSFFSFSSK